MGSQNVTRQFTYGNREYTYEYEPRTLQHDGLIRTYCLYVPGSLDQSNPVPLVLVFHGGSGTGDVTIGLSLGRLNELADAENFIAVYPDGIDNIWNDGSGVKQWKAHRENVDDVGFATELIDTLRDEFNIDESRVYACGMSLGGMLSFRLACEIPERIAAIGAVACGMWVGLPERCSPSIPTPVLMIRGTADPMVPWEGGLTGIEGMTQRFMEVLSGKDVTAFWVDKNGCDPEPEIHHEPDADPDDGMRVKRETYRGGSADTEVILYTVEGGGHTWPSGHQYWGEHIIGKTCNDIDASDAIWDFFKRKVRE